MKFKKFNVVSVLKSWGKVDDMSIGAWSWMQLLLRVLVFGLHLRFKLKKFSVYASNQMIILILS